MSGRERLQALTASRAGELLKRILVVDGLLAFLVLGLALEARQANQHRSLSPIKSTKKTSAVLSARFAAAFTA